MGQGRNVQLTSSTRWLLILALSTAAGVSSYIYLIYQRRSEDLSLPLKENGPYTPAELTTGR